ncbi:MAG: UDP-glucose 4-epimerase GalE [Anaerolineae bacterium]|nr:UDP-glucose 4-epimerase GalE [Anaerolineae bacterium]NUQ02851.1 UDP-glucose 4-epimerase GalE [Anaerolineae bacterium]
MNVLVTGGAGYIGSHMVDTLIRRGDSVTVFDSLVTGHREAVHPDAKLVVGDLLDPAAINAAFDSQAFDGIYHFASYIVVPESMQKPFKYLRDNVIAAANLLEAAAAHGVKRFILSSTAALFDQPSRVPIDESERVIPGSPYGESKAMIERLLVWVDRIYGMKTCALRYFNAAGAHPSAHIGEDHDPESHLIPIILQVALGQRDSVVVYGDDYPTPDGTAIRDYIHALDLASAHILAMEALADGPSRAYNLGTGRGFSVREVVKCAREVTTHPIPTTSGPRRAGDLAELVADSTAIQRELGWRPQYIELQQIIETAWHWHSTHPRGYASVNKPG